MSPPASGPALDELRRDLAAEVASLASVVDGRSVEELSIDTPAVGWTVSDTLAHLASFDGHARTAIVDPDRFRADLERVLTSGPDPIRDATDRGRTIGAEATRTWWHEASLSLLDACRTIEPGQRLPWYGPDMGAMSFLSARLMENWAHGLDIRDALGIAVEPTDRLRHVVDLGVRTRGFSYVNRGLDPPTAAVRVELGGPGGVVWAWGDDDTSDHISGPALDFALVVTQRRNLADTTLTVEGAAAREWMSIAQAFAGGPTENRPPAAGTSWSGAERIGRGTRPVRRGDP